MRKSSMLLLRLAKELEAEIEGMEKLIAEFESLPGGEESYLIRARASIFHDFYSAAERVFQKIAEELNGGVPKSEQWHKELLFDMTLDLEGVRPPVVRKSLEERLLPFLRFRHIFRNMYGYELRADRIRELGTSFVPAAEETKDAVAEFCRWMREQAEDRS